jgi:branched-chain amino acid transport system substrate-binding protein
MKKIYIILGVVILIALGIVFSSKKTGAEDTTKIAVIGPMTGSSVGVYYEPLKKGIDIALSEINKDSKKIEVVYQDDQLDSKLSLSAYNQLKAGGVKYFILNGSPAASAVGPLIRTDGNLSMVPSALLTAYKDDSPLTCRIALTADNYGPAFTDLLINKLGKKQVATMVSNTEGAMAIFNVFKEKYEAVGGKIVQAETFGKDDIDFRTQITKIKANKNAEALVIINWSSTIVPMLTQMKELGLKLPVFSDTASIKNSAIKDLSLANGITFLDYSFSLDDQSISDIAKKFINDYAQLYTGEKPGIQALQGFDSVKILAYALSKANPEKPSSVADFIVNDIKNYPLAGGNFSFNNTCEATRDITIRKVSDGKIVNY